MKDVYKELLDEPENKPKGKYCCQECGKGWKYYDEYLVHMKKKHNRLS